MSSPLLTASECPGGPADGGTDPAAAPSAPATRLRDAGDDPRVRHYGSHFADLMEMRAPAALVSQYLDRHEGWFRRCAAPMTVTPLGCNGYQLTLGRFGNFGFEVEPTIGLELLPQNAGVYRILTVPVPRQDEGLDGLYDVEFNAALRLEEDAANDNRSAAEQLTLVRWELDLGVWIRLPGVVTLLPDNLVQNSGDHLLRQIVRQISRRLTWKVQEDFHASHGLDCPPRRRARF